MGPLFVGTLVLVGAMLQFAVSQAQITLDGTMGPKGPLTGPKFVIDSNLGRTRGTTLFYSFGQFNVRTGESATFTNTSSLSIANILSRVTGGQRSFIDGLVQSTIPGANLFLLNPSGVLFGAHATIDVKGSFHVSTADYLRLADGTRFSAQPVAGELLTTATPTAFGFLGPTPAAISIQGSKLQVPNNQALSVVGGDLQIVGGTTPTLAAPGGQVQVASVASAGEARLGATGQAPNLDVSSFTRLGHIDISGIARLDASRTDAGGGGGTVLIRGGRLIVENSSLVANTGNVNGARVGIDVQVAGDVTLTKGSAQIGTSTLGTGRAGDITLSVGSLAVAGGAQISSLNLRGGRGGDITVTAASSIDVSGRSLANNPSVIVTQTLGSGNGGRVSISAPSLTMDDTGSINSNALLGGGRGGDVVVAVDRLTLSGGARIRSTARAGPGGNVTVRATGAVTFSGDSSGILMSGFSIAHVGDVSLNAGKLTLTRGAQIQSGSPFDLSQGGNVTLAASDQVVISNGGGLSSQSFNLDAGRLAVSAPTLTMDSGFINTSTLGKGRAGDIALNVGTLTLTGGAQIASSSQKSSTGHGGSVTVTARDSVTIAGRSSTRVGSGPVSTEASSGLFSTAASTGAAGQITVSSPTLTMTNGGKISVATAGAGRAGDIALTVGTLSLTGGARVDSSTSGAGRGGAVTVTAAGSVSVGSGGGLSSNAGSSGAGGDINIRAGQVQLTGGARISATSSATGNAGTLTIDAGDAFRSQDSSVTTEARQADGGSISLSARSMVHLIDSKITTSVGSGSGKGGNITIDPTFVILDHSQVRADAFGGPGGNVNIAAVVYLATDSVVSASSALGVPGTINIQASITNVSGTLAQLPGAVLQAAALLRASCGARLAASKASSLVLAGRDGLPPEPGGLLPSAILAEGPADARLSWSEGHQWEIFPRLSRSVVGPKCSM
jgi:filamentous hemagglutinin family protein